MTWGQREVLADIVGYLIPLLCCLPLWLVLRRPWKRRPVAREIAMAVLVCSMAALLALTLQGSWSDPLRMLQSALSRLKSGEKIQLTPFVTLRSQLEQLPLPIPAAQLLGNTLLFAPWGFFLPLLWPRLRHPLKLAGLALALPLFIECMQLFIDRYVEVDDVLLNFLGAMAGSGLWWCVRRCFPRLDEHLLIAP